MTTSQMVIVMNINADANDSEYTRLIAHYNPDGLADTSWELMTLVLLS